LIAVISDIHGNLAALEAVLAELDRLGPSEVVVGGDLALGGPRPAECVSLIRRRGYPAIRGNTDEWLTKAPAKITDGISWCAGARSQGGGRGPPPPRGSPGDRGDPRGRAAEGPREDHGRHQRVRAPPLRGGPSVPGR